MLKYVREQLKKQGVFAESVVNNVDELDDDMFVEAAHVLDELGELSGHGDSSIDRDAIRNPISIPLEDDIEIDTVEFCMVDSRMSDIPGDAALQEAYYDDLKHFSDFYAEAYHTTTRLPRESSDTFADRVFDRQNQLYNEYMETIIQEGLFGFGEIKASDESVPWKIHLNFGKLRANGGEEFNATLPLVYEIKKGKLLKKQLEAVKFYDYAKIHGYDVMMDYAESKNIKVPKDGNVWDVIEPKLVYVPREQNALYKIVIQFKNHTSGEEFYFSISATMRGNKKKDVKSKSPDMDIVDSKEGSFEMKSTSKPSAHFVDRQMVTEAYVEAYMPSRWNNNNYYQEAIDFGGGGDPPEMAGAPAAQPAGDVPPAPDGNAAPPAPAPETNNAQPSSTNINIDLPPEEGQGDANATDTQDNNQPADPPQAENPNANDVTDQIANGVNEGLDKQNASNDVDLSADVSEDPNFDMNATTEPDMNNVASDPSLDADLENDINNSDLGDNPDVDIDTDPNVDMDFDKMTLNQLIEQAQEKAKDMTIDQLKEFLMNNTMPNGEEVGADAVEDGVQEGFFNYSRANINDTLDRLLRKALGILNDQKLELGKLIKEFKKNGKKLNKALSQAVKYENIYDAQEKKQLSLLNRCLVDLMSMIKENSSESNTQTAKRLVKAFTSQAKAVGEIIDAHKQTKPVQEGAITALFNIRENLERKANYVHINVTMPIKNKVDADKLTLAFIKSYFKSKKETVETGTGVGAYGDAYGYGTAYGTSTSHSTEYETDNARTNRLKVLKELGVRIETKDRKRAKFSETELRNLDRTIHLSNELYDDITSALKVQREDEADKLLNAIGKEAVELDALCQTFKKQRSDK